MPFIKHEAAFIYLIIERVPFHQRGLLTLEERREPFPALLGTIKGSQHTANGKEKIVRAPSVENSPRTRTDFVLVCGSFRPFQYFPPNIERCLLMGINYAN